MDSEPTPYTSPDGTSVHRNLVLVGFMGSGKTTVGRELAKKLNFAFVDTDEEIVKAAGGRPITEIFASEGEAGFRHRERETLEAVATRNHTVISTGGGAVLSEENREILKRAGFVVWLDTAPETVFERVRRNQERPLLQTEDPELTIRTLLEERAPAYRAACHYRIDTSGLCAEEIAYGIKESVLAAAPPPR